MQETKPAPQVQMLAVSRARQCFETIPLYVMMTLYSRMYVNDHLITQSADALCLRCTGTKSDKKIRNVVIFEAMPLYDRRW
jgi:hypothetical protein